MCCILLSCIVLSIFDSMDSHDDLEEKSGKQKRKRNRRTKADERREVLVHIRSRGRRMTELKKEVRK